MKRIYLLAIMGLIMILSFLCNLLPQTYANGQISLLMKLSSEITEGDFTTLDFIYENTNELNHAKSIDFELYSNVELRDISFDRTLSDSNENSFSASLISSTFDEEYIYSIMIEKNDLHDDDFFSNGHLCSLQFVISEDNEEFELKLHIEDLIVKNGNGELVNETILKPRSFYSQKIVDNNSHVISPYNSINSGLGLFFDSKNHTVGSKNKASIDIYLLDYDDSAIFTAEFYLKSSHQLLNIEYETYGRSDYYALLLNDSSPDMIDSEEDDFFYYKFEFSINVLEVEYKPIYITSGLLCSFTFTVFTHTLDRLNISSSYESFYSNSNTYDVINNTYTYLELETLPVSDGIDISSIIIDDKEVNLNTLYIETTDYKIENVSLEIIMNKGSVKEVKTDKIINHDEQGKYLIPLKGCGYIQHVNIVLIAEDGLTEKEEILSIFRAKSTDCLLKNVEIDGNTLPTPKLYDEKSMSLTLFNKNIYEYTVGYSTELSEIVFTPTLSDVNSKILVGEIEYSDGQHIKINNFNEPFVIKVISQSEDYKIYTFNFKILSDDNSIKTIDIYGKTKDENHVFLGNPTLINDEYQLNVKNNSLLSFSVEVTPSNDESKVSYEPNFYSFYQYISETGKIIVKITSESGVTKEYCVKVRKESANEKLDMIVSVIGVNDEIEYYPTNESDGTRFVYYIPKSVEKVNVKVEPVDKTTIVSGSGIYDIPCDEFFICARSTDGDELKIKIVFNYEKDTDNTISNINLLDEINGNNLKDIDGNSFVYNKDITIYDLIFPYEQDYVYVEVIPSSLKSSIHGDGLFRLEVGNNLLKIYAVSESGIKGKEYTINIKRENIDDDSTLSMIKLDGLELEGFDSKITEYKYYVDENKDFIEIICILSSNESILLFDNGNKKLNMLNNVFEIKVKSKTGTIKQYVLDIVRAECKNTITDIKIYTDNDTLLTNYIFNKDIYLYNIEVLYAQSTLFFDVLYDGKNGTIYGNGLRKIEKGPNNIEIYVESQAGVKGHVYTYIINRLEADSNSYLKSLEINVDGKNLISSFDKNKERYIISINESINEIHINAISDSQTSVVQGNGVFLLGNNDDYIKNGMTIIIVTVTSESGNVRKYDICVYREDVNLSDDNQISTVMIRGNDGNIYFYKEFSSDVFSYEIVIPYRVSAVSVTVESKGEISGEGLYNLNLNSNNIIKVFATSDSGVQGNVYVFSLLRQPPNEDTRLKNLKIDDKQIDGFESTKERYEVSFEFDKESIDLCVELNNPNATKIIKLKGNIIYDSIITLSQGNNNINIFVYADNDIYKVYSILIYREYKKCNLSNLLITGYNLLDHNNEIIDFNSTTYDYYVNVPYDKKEIEIISTIQDDDFYIVTGNKELVVGDNIIYIRVVSKYNDMQYTEYTIHAYREYKESNRINIFDFSIQEIDGFNKMFEEEIFEYNIDVNSNISSLNMDINFEKNDDEKEPSIEMIGGENLKFGNNEVIIIITSSDGTITKKYKINVTRRNVVLSHPVIDEIDDFTFDFRNDVDEYTYNVSSRVAVLHISFDTDSKDTTYVISENKLKVGRNEINIDVYSKNEKVRQIKLIVYRTDSNISTQITPFIIGGGVGIVSIIVVITMIIVLKKKDYEKEERQDKQLSKKHKTLKK